MQGLCKEKTESKRKPVRNVARVWSRFLSVAESKERNGRLWEKTELC